MDLGFVILVVGDCGGCQLVAFFVLFLVVVAGSGYDCGLLGLRRKWWVFRERERQRERKREYKKQYLNEMVKKNRIFDVL